MSETWSNIGGECDYDHDMHFIGLDVLYHELINPESGEPIKWEQGAVGELVLTHLVKECQPLVRFRTRDIIHITSTEPCQCGRTGARFQVMGRSDDMLIVRGVNVFPSAVAIVLNSIPELSGEFQIRLRGPGPLDRLPIEAELAMGGAPSERLAARIEKAIRDTVGASAKVTLVSFRKPATHGRQGAKNYS